MLNLFNINAIRGQLQTLVLWLAAIVLMLASTLPLYMNAQVSAAELTSRNVLISSSQPSATGVTYRFNFTLPTATALQSILFQFCTTALGACTKPTGLNINYTLTSTNATQTFSEATAFTEYSGADAGTCDDHNNGTPANSTEYCMTRTDTDSETAIGKSIAIDTITNASITGGTNNTPIFARIYLYSDTAFATQVHYGTVVASIVNQLTVTGRVQERLVFCVFALEDAAGSSATVGDAATNFPTRCASAEALASTSVDIGVVDNSSIAYSPVNNTPPTSFGNDQFGAAMVNTNASGGVGVTYYASTATTGTEELQAFRVSGATCVNGGLSNTDQCFRSADEVAGETFTAGTERFGMQIVCVTNSNTTTAGTTANLGSGGNGAGTGNTFNTVYANGDTTLTGGTGIQDTIASDDCENTEAGMMFGWNDSATAQALIGSTSVVDDELIKLRFGATSNATTPTGTYTVASTFIATATFQRQDRVYSLNPVEYARGSLFFVNNHEHYSQNRPE